MGHPRIVLGLGFVLVNRLITTDLGSLSSDCGGIDPDLSATVYPRSCGRDPRSWPPTISTLTPIDLAAAPRLAVVDGSLSIDDGPRSRSSPLERKSSVPSSL